jgi:hypothetical protein
MNRRLVVLVLAAIAALAGCGAGDPNEPAPSTRTIPPSTLSPATTLVSGLPRQVGTEGNFQVFEVTAHQRALVAQNAVKVLTRQGLWDQGVRFGITDPFKKQHFVLINPGTVAAQAGVEGVQGGGVQLADLEPAEAGQDRAVNVAAVGGHGRWRNRPDTQAPLQPVVDQLGDRLVLPPRCWPAAISASSSASTCLACFTAARPLPGTWRADPAHAAGGRVAAGVHLDLQAVAIGALSDHYGPSVMPF